MVSAATFGGKVNVAAGTRKLEITAQLDDTLNADTYAMGSYATAFSEVYLIAISPTVRFSGGESFGGLSALRCRIEHIGGNSGALEIEERQAKEVLKRAACTFAVESGSGEVSLGFGVRVGVDAEFSAVAQADGRLEKIRGVQVAFVR